MDNEIKFSIQSIPKHAPKDAKPNTEEFTRDGLEAARAEISKQIKLHKKNSRSFNIYWNGNLIFNSTLIRG